MPLNQVSAAMIQSVARKVIALDPEAANGLSSFDDKVIKIEIEDFGLCYFFSFEGGTLTVSNDDSRPVSAAINGNLAAFLAAAANEHSVDSIFKGELHFSGEIGTAKRFQEFAQSLEIDWQEPIARALGDPIGHTLTTGLQAFGGWLLNTGRSTRQDISEYLQEEIKVTPPAAEQQLFFEQVDQTRSKTDRLAARIKKLKQATVSLTPLVNSNNSKT
jgi:ubiquinone biosynthesis accessory factor UbiJ